MDTSWFHFADRLCFFWKGFQKKGWFFLFVFCNDWTKIFEAFSINRDSFPGANTFFSSHYEGLADFFSFLFFQTVSKSSTLPICQRVSIFFFCFFFNRPKLWGSCRLPRRWKGGKQQFLCLHESFFSEAVAYLISCRVWLIIFQWEPFGLSNAPQLSP